MNFVKRHLKEDTESSISAVGQLMHLCAVTWYSARCDLKQRVNRLMLLILDLSEPAAPTTAAAKYLSKQLL